MITGHAQTPVVLITGSDDRGLMYALLDVADRIGWATNASDPFAEVHDTREKPDAPERGVSIYTMHRATFEQRFYDEKYWSRYFDMLARDRFDNFVLIFGYENGGWRDGYFAVVLYQRQALRGTFRFQTCPGSNKNGTCAL